MRHFLDHPAGWMPSRLADIYDETSFWSARFGALLFDRLESAAVSAASMSVAVLAFP
jgi:hypothetical protein